MSDNDFERLAIAFEDAGLDHIEAFKVVSREEVRRGLVAVLRAMQEPSQWQEDAGRRKRTETLGATPAAIYGAMIDAILAQAPAELRDSGEPEQTILDAG